MIIYECPKSFTYVEIFSPVVALFVKLKTIDTRHFIGLSVVCFYIFNDRVINLQGLDEMFVWDERGRGLVW